MVSSRTSILAIRSTNLIAASVQGRADDYVEISLESEYRYNPLHNDLDAYALAYNIASLLNNLFGRGKEPFWQQAYTNLVKFIILLHKVAFDYVTLFDVYECAINPDLLESKIKEADRRLIEADSALLWEEEYLKHPRDLDPFKFRLDKESNRFRAPLTTGLLAVLKDKDIQWEAENASRKNPAPALVLTPAKLAGDSRGEVIGKRQEDLGAKRLQESPPRFKGQLQPLGKRPRCKRSASSPARPSLTRRT